MPSGNPWEEKASRFGWLSLKGTKKEKRAPLGNWVQEHHSSSSSAQMTTVPGLEFTIKDLVGDLVLPPNR